MKRAATAVAIVLVLVGISSAQKVFDKAAEKEAAEISKAIGKTLNFVETKSFTWAVALPPAKLKPISDVAEKAFDMFCTNSGVTNWQVMWGDQKPLCALVPTKRDFRKLNAWYAKKYRSFDEAQFIKLKNKSNYWPLADTRRFMAAHIRPWGEEHMRVVVAHLVGHMVAQRYAFNNNFVPPWLEESTAVYYEIQTLKRTNCGCFKDPYDTRELDPERKNIGITRSKWLSRARKEIAAHNVRRMQALFRPRLFDLTRKDIYKGYAVVDWMMSKPGKYAAFLREMKRVWPDRIVWDYIPEKGEAQKKAFKKVFDMTLDEVDQAVTAHAARMK